MSLFGGFLPVKTWNVAYPGLSVARQMKTDSKQPILHPYRDNGATARLAVERVTGDFERIKAL